MITTKDGLILWLVMLDDQRESEPDVALVLAKDEATACRLASEGPGVKDKQAWIDASCARPYADTREHIVTQYACRYLPENLAEEET